MKTQKNRRDPSSTIEVLFQISEAVNRTRNLQELYSVIHKSLGKILKVDNFYIALLDQEEDTLFFPYHVDKIQAAPASINHFSTTISSVGIVIREKTPRMFFREDIIRLASPKIDGTLPRPSKVWLGAPLIVDKTVKGAIVIQSYESEADYEKEDLDLLNSVSQHIALSIERKETEEKFFDQKNILEKILESSPVGIALIENRVFKWVNNEMVRMFGYRAKSDFQNMSTRMIYADEVQYGNVEAQIYGNVKNSGNRDYEGRLVRRDGTRFPVHARMNSGSPDDPMAWNIVTFTDISLLKATEKETFEKERLQGVLEMAGAVCHEINQPLQAILGYSELLLMGMNSGAEPDQNGVNAIKRQASRLGNITRKLSRITCYRTVDYPGKTKIVDIWKASREKDS